MSGSSSGSLTPYADLMGLESSLAMHQTDDETQKILVRFFNSAAFDTHFQDGFNKLTDAEKQKLAEMDTANV